MVRIKWTTELIQEVAFRYSGRREFQVKEPAAYQAAYRRGIVDQVCSHMKLKVKRPFTISELQLEALKYTSRKEFEAGSRSQYASARNKGILDDICTHMILKKRRAYTKNELTIISKEYSTPKQFEVGNESAYKRALALGLNKVAPHLEYKRTYYTKDAAMELARSCGDRVEFIEKYRSCYYFICNKGYLPLLDLIHPQERMKWNAGMLKDLAKNYETAIDFKKDYGGAYSFAKKLGVWGEITAHFIPQYQQISKWSKKTAFSAAKKYKVRGVFSRNDGGAYAWLCRKGLLKEACMHMKRGCGVSDDDVIYIWETDQLYEKNKVYKIGATSQRCDDRRIHDVACDSGFVVKKIIRLKKIKGRATEVEDVLLTYGVHPEYYDIDGATEFRALSEKELVDVINVIDTSME